MLGRWTRAPRHVVWSKLWPLLMDGAWSRYELLFIRRACAAGPKKALRAGEENRPGAPGAKNTHEEERDKLQPHRLKGTLHGQGELCPTRT